MLPLLMLIAGSMVTPPQVDVLISPSDARIHYTGRFDTSDPRAVRFDWSGSVVEFSFRGTGVDMVLEDSLNMFNVYVNGAPSSILAVSPGVDRYELARDLPFGEYTIRIVRRTEPLFGVSVFRGIVLEPGGELLSRPAAPAAWIEFVGDSITCGYGNEGDSPTCRFSRETENVERSFAAMTADAFSMGYAVVAWSGKGLVRNYGDTLLASDRPMPSFYGLTVANDTGSQWAFDEPAPALVVVNLGTNDVSTGLQPERGVFIEAYLELLAGIRARRGDVPVIAISGPIMRDPAREFIAAAVADARRSDPFVHHVHIENTLVRPDDLGCDAHPNVAGHRKIADQLISALLDILAVR
jgi:lysophospholipase L1-like esterase